MDLLTPKTTSRRNFLATSAKIGVACGFACMCPFSVYSEENAESDTLPDLTKLNYCSYKCPDDCPMKLAGLSDDVEQKRKAYETWKIKERYGLEFDPKTVFCNGCRTDQKLGVAAANCPVRKCAIERKVVSCVKCDELKTCDKALWKSFPGFHKQVIQLQDRFATAAS